MALTILVALVTPIVLELVQALPAEMEVCARN